MNTIDESKANSPETWSFWIDRGGTFTDIIAVSSKGRLLAKKKLSESGTGKDPILEGLNEILEQECSSLSKVTELRIGTTIGTNALLERKGARTVLITSTGFKDAVNIAYQNRPDIFALEIKLPQPLYEDVIEFNERIDAHGNVIIKPDLESLKKELEAVFRKGINSAAIVLMHGYKYTQHEAMAAEIAREIGFTSVSCSHEVSALQKFIARADTTLVDAYLTPLLRDYVKRLQSSLKEVPIQFMQSNGGLVDAAIFRGKDSIISGPAGGIIGAVQAAHDCGFDEVVSFDMGGTSTDVSYFGGEIEHIYESEIAGTRIRAPMMDIHTIAAGGGSILGFDGKRLLVGPQSSGASPGPMCYGRNGPLSLTDANLFLGRIQLKHFPKIFGADGKSALDLSAVETAFTKLCRKVNSSLGSNFDPEELAAGFLKIAVTKMAHAIKHVSVQRGHDLRSCALVCFGGAGAQHACLIAEELGIKNIIIHPLAGVLSAYGIGVSEKRLSREFDVKEELNSVDFEALNYKLRTMEAELKSKLLLSYSKNRQCDKENSDEFLKQHELSITALLSMQGSDYSLNVEFADKESMSRNFLTKHMKRYGFIDETRPLLLDSLSLQLVSLSPKPSVLKQAAKESRACSRGRLYLINHESTDSKTKKWQDCTILERDSLAIHESIEGPAIIAEANTCTVIDPSWKAEVLENGSLLLSPSRKKASAKKAPASDRTTDIGLEADPDPITLELFNNLFRFIAEQMGITLQNTSQSVNIKERLDFSCALFDADGNLVANAPHIPVHLGSMGEAVQNLITCKGNELRAGQAYASNDPYAGGTHLPDITVISPVFGNSDDSRAIAFVASRGHHADIGGISPGSMPSASKNIEEEGIILRHVLVAESNRVLEPEIREQLCSGKYPARNPSQNLADLKAQIAANNRGSSQILELVEHWGQATVTNYMAFVQDNAEHSVRSCIEKLNSGSFTCPMDDGNQIRLAVKIDRDRQKAYLDFSGSSGQSQTNFNAPFAVCKAAVLYVFRTLVEEEIPLNAGCFRPIELLVPEDSLLNPSFPAAVVAGNVETSQVIVDAIYGALGILANSQGTMNNLSFGNSKYQYYETISGGTGAGAGFNGNGPVQSHMTNSRLTDPEVLESRFPVILESFSVRKKSGGEGRFRGGDGAQRKIRFLEEMTVSILSNRRTTSALGMAGGKPGSPGRNLLIKSNGETEELAFRAQFQVQAGDCLLIETPGGGGYGTPTN